MQLKFFHLNQLNSLFLSSSSHEISSWNLDNELLDPYGPDLNCSPMYCCGGGGGASRRAYGWFSPAPPLGCFCCCGWCC